MFLELLHMKILASEKQQNIQNHCYRAETCTTLWFDLLSPTYILFLNFNISILGELNVQCNHIFKSEKQTWANLYLPNYNISYWKWHLRKLMFLNKCISSLMMNCDWPNCFDSEFYCSHITYHMLNSDN